MQGVQFPFVEREAERGVASLAPMLPLTLVGARVVAVAGLLDTGQRSTCSRTQPASNSDSCGSDRPPR